MWWLTAALGVVAIAGALAYGAYRRWQTEFLKDLDLSDAFASLEATWTPEPFPNSGRLPMSTHVVGAFFRWHSPGYYFTGAEFWKTFQDGPWKWADRQRYAGAGDNCGHYFALTEAGATAEAGFYALDLSR